MAISFGLPQRPQKQEMFPDTPVISLLEWQGKGFANKFSFNTSAIELLQVIPGVSQVYFAVNDETKEVYIGKYESEDSITVTKSNSIANKKFYEYIIKNYNLDNTKDNYMELTESVDLGGVIVYKLQNIILENKEVEVFTPIVDKEIEHLLNADVDEEVEEVIQHESHGRVW